MAILNDNFTLRAPVPIDDRRGWWDDVDKEWKPFNSVQHALETVVYYRFRTLTLPVVEDGDVVEYWFKDGIDDADFVKKTSQVDLSNYYTKTDLQTPGSAIIDWANIANAPAASSLDEVLDVGNTTDNIIVFTDGTANMVQVGYTAILKVADDPMFHIGGFKDDISVGGLLSFTNEGVDLSSTGGHLKFTVDSDVKAYFDQADNIFRIGKDTFSSTTLYGATIDATHGIGLYSQSAPYYGAIIINTDPVNSRSAIGISAGFDSVFSLYSASGGPEIRKGVSYIVSESDPSETDLSSFNIVVIRHPSLYDADSDIISYRYRHTSDMGDAVERFGVRMDGRAWGTDPIEDEDFVTKNYFDDNIPTQVNADWDAVSGPAEILNKPAFSTVAFTGDYDDLTNKPSIPDLTGYATESWVLGQGFLTSVSSSWDGNTGVLTIQGNNLSIDGRYMLRSNTITSGYGIIASSDFSGPISIQADTDVLDNRYLRKDQNDSNSTYTLTLGSLVSGTATINSTLTLSSVGAGSTSDEFLTITSGGVVQKVALPTSSSTFTIANNAGVSQFTVSGGDTLRFNGTGDASVAFNAATKTITINSSGGSSGGGVDSWNARTGHVVPELGDYTTDLVTEATNLYFTQARVRSSVLTGFSASNAAIVATDTVLEAFGKAQGQINNRVPTSRTITINGTAGNITASGGTLDLSANRSWTLNLSTVGTPGTYTKVATDAYGRVTSGTSLTLGDMPSGVLQDLGTGSLAGEITISGGAGTTLTSLSRVSTNDSFSSFFDSRPLGFHHYSNTTGSTGHPSDGFGAGILIRRTGGTDTRGSFVFWKANTGIESLYYRVGIDNAGGWSDWKTIADRDWVTNQIPAPQTISYTPPIPGPSATHGGNVSLTNGGQIYINTTALILRQDANERFNGSVLSGYYTQSGHSNYPGTNVGAGIRVERRSTDTSQTGFELYRETNAGFIRYKTFDAESTENGWEIIASRNWVTSQIPAAQTLSLGSNSGQITISSGNTVTLSTLNRENTAAAFDTFFASLTQGLIPYLNTTGSTGYPSDALGAGVIIKRNTSNNSQGSFALWAANSATELLFYRVGTSASNDWSDWKTIADRDWVMSQIPTIPTNYVTTNTDQTSISGTKQWVGTRHVWAPPSASAPSVEQAKLDIGRTSSGVYLRVGQSSSASQSFILRGYVSNGSQFELSEGGINIPPSSSSTTGHLLSGNNVVFRVTTSDNTIVSTPNVAAGVYLRPNGSGSSTNEAMFSSTVKLSALAGSGTQMVVADASGVLGRQAIPSLSGYYKADYLVGPTSTVTSADANTSLPQGGIVTSYTTSNWLTNGPNGFTYGGLIDFAGRPSDGRLSLQLAWSAGHGGEADSRLAFRTEYGTTGGSYRSWKEFWHTGNFDPDSKANTVHTHTWSQISGGNTSLIPGAGSSQAHGSLDISGSKGSYAGITFTSASNHRFMIHTSNFNSGIYSGSAWIWQFNGAGELATGTVPWARITGAPSIPTVNNGTLTLSGGNGLTGSATFTANSASNVTFTVNVGAGTGISVGADSVGLTDIAAGSGTVGAVRYNGTTRSSGRFYGGTTNPQSSTRLNYDGILHAYDLVTYGTSDIRLKTNLKPIEDALEKINKLTGYTFAWREGHDSYIGNDMGVIAQEVESVFPDIVSNEGPYKRIKNGNQLIAVLIQAVKELSTEIERLKDGLSKSN